MLQLTFSRLSLGIQVNDYKFQTGVSYDFFTKKSAPAAIPGGMTEYKFVNAAPCDVNLATVNNENDTNMLTYQEVSLVTHSHK